MILCTNFTLEYYIGMAWQFSRMARRKRDPKSPDAELDMRSMDTSGTLAASLIAIAV